MFTVLKGEQCNESAFMYFMLNLNNSTAYFLLKLVTTSLGISRVMLVLILQLLSNCVI